MKNCLGPGQSEQLGKPLRGCDVCCCITAEETPWKGQEPELPTRQPAFLCVAAQTFVMAACHEVARTGGLLRLIDKLTVGTNSLKAVVFDDNGFAGHQTKQQRQESRTGEMNDVG